MANHAVRAWVWGLAGAVAGLTVAVAGVPGAGGGAWKETTFKGIPPTEFVVQANGTIHITANRSSSLIHRKLTRDERGKPLVSWQWRVSDPVPATDLTRKGKDDRAVALHLWFPAGPGGGLFAGLKRSFARLAGKPVPGNAISYTWGGNVPAGTLLPNPFMKGAGVIIVLRASNSETGVWVTERVDILADFERAFGYRGELPVGLALSGDSDDTATLSRATVRDIRFTKPQEQESGP